MSEIRVTITAIDRATPQLVAVAMRFQALRRVAERTAVRLRILLRRKPQGPRPKHYPRRRRGR